jgi:CRISPR-associated protein Cas1
MQTIQNTLYVSTPIAYVHLENATVRIDVEREKKLQVPLHHIGSVVCFGNVMVSPALMHRLAEEGKSLALLDDHGRFKARLEGPVSGNVLLRQAQFETARDPARAHALARHIVAGKIRNTRHVLMRGARDSSSEADAAALSAAAAHLAASLRAVEASGDLDVLRGIEGEAARTYFEAFSKLIAAPQRDAFAMNGRSRRPPRDRINALLSFLYTLLTHDCRSAAEAVGLDSQVGFLHALRPGRPALALDLAEEFRAYLADRLALSLINRRQIGADDFVLREGGAVTLKDDARREVIIAWQNRKQESLAHPMTESDVPAGLLPHLQSRLMARVLRGDVEAYIPFIAR